MDDNELLMSGFTKQKVFFNGGSLSLIFINPKKIRMLIIIITVAIIYNNKNNNNDDDDDDKSLFIG